MNNEIQETSENSIYGFTGYTTGIGDQVIVTSFPENFYRNFKIKIIDIQNCWVFDHNPYIQRGIEPSVILSHFDSVIPKIINKTRKDCKSDAEELCINLGVPKMFLRRPRLYKYEDSKTEKDLVLVHTTGKSVGSMPDHVIDKISKNYSDYNIVQIGSSTDAPTPFNKQLDLTKWDTVELISKAAIYIGVNSGFYHVATAYPKVRKKIILHELSEERIHAFEPRKQSIQTEWLDYNVEYFNTSEIDIGATNSYNMI
jgi:hypothetical protein